MHASPMSPSAYLMHAGLTDIYAIYDIIIAINADFVATCCQQNFRFSYIAMY